MAIFAATGSSSLTGTIITFTQYGHIVGGRKWFITQQQKAESSSDAAVRDHNYFTAITMIS